jgi:acyl carrier protein
MSQTLNYPSVLAEVERIICEIARSKKVKVPSVRESSRLLGGDLPIDSLDLSRVLVQLEAATGYDPFKEGFIDFRTVGELARLYVR